MNAKDSTYPICRHLKTNGRRCQGPALAGGALCYFHRNLHRTHRRPLKAEHIMSTWKEETLKGFRLANMDPLAIARAYPQQNEIHFPALEDADSVQLASSMLFQAIATGQVHFERSRVLLYALRIATLNLRNIAAANKFDAANKSETDTTTRNVVRTTNGHTLAAPDPVPNEIVGALDPPPDARVPHSSQLHREGWDVNPPLTTSPDATNLDSGPMNPAPTARHIPALGQSQPEGPTYVSATETQTEPATLIQ